MDSACMAHSVRILFKISWRLCEIIWDYAPVVGGSTPEVPPDTGKTHASLATHPHTCNTHERSINACVPHSLHSSLHILYEIQLRLYEILRDSAPVRGGSAQGNRRFGSTSHPGETHPYSLIIYIFLIAFPSSMQYFQKRMFLSILFFRVYC